jgi:hypothetical protein
MVQRHFDYCENEKQACNYYNSCEKHWLCLLWLEIACAANGSASVVSLRYKISNAMQKNKSE